MAINNVSVTTPGMKQAAGHFEAASSSSTAQLQRVHSEQAALRTVWTGDASARFGHAMNDWEQQFGIIVKELNHMIEAMGANATKYTATEQDATQTAGSWSAGLTGI
jgi:WXG100 family type VII secretion target